MQAADDAPARPPADGELDTPDQLRLLSTALHAAANAVMITDRDGVIQWVNRAFSDRTGYSFEEAIGRTPGDLIGSGTHDPEFFREFWETITAGEVWRGRMVNRRKDGELFAEEQTVTPVQDPSGRVSHFIAVKVDLTEREEASRRIRFQAELLDAVGQAVIATDLDGGVLYWNRAAEELFGWSEQEALGRDVVELTAPAASMEDARQIMGRLRQGKSWMGEFSLRRRDGSTFHGLVTDSPILDDEGRLVGIIGVTTDVTETREMEARLRQAEKMEAIGRLAGGVSHDFNNLLMAIRGHSQILLEDLPADAGRLREEAQQVLSEVERATRLTRQLLSFSRRRGVREEVLDLGRTVAGMQALLRRLIPSRIQLRFEATDERSPVRGDPSQIEQVVLNLAVNAADAIAQEGRITFRIDSRALTDEELNAVGWPLPPGTYARLTVEDTGEGMSTRVMERIFEPFFSTKPEGEGTGLGLSTVFGIVKQSRGWVLVNSELGRGSTFQVLLPLVMEAEAGAHTPVKDATPAPDAQTPIADPAGRTVLVVDDTPSVLRVTCRFLARAGYTVIPAATGREALEALERRPDEIALVLSDVVMPDMGGARLLDRILERYPDLRVILMSGHGEGEVPDAMRQRASAFLSKPYGPDELVQLVGSVLAD